VTVGSRALGSDLQQPHFAHPRDAAAAGADLHQVHDRHLDRQPAAFLEALHPAHLEGRDQPRLPVLDQAGLGGGPAHVEAEDVRDREHPAVVLRCDDGGGGARFADPHREFAGGFHRGDPAARKHDVELALESLGFQPSGKLLQVAGGDRLDVGVGGGRARALVFADLGQHFHRGGQEHLGPLLLHQRLDLPFVVGVAVGVDQAHRQRLDPGAAQLGQRSPDLLRIEPLDHPAVAGDALVDLQAQPPRHQRSGVFGEDVVGVVAQLAAEFEHVPEPLRGDQTGEGALAFDDGVDHQRGAVDDLVDVRLPAGDLVEQRADALLHGIGGVCRRRQAFMDIKLPGLIVDQHEVREGAPDVAAETVETFGHKTPKL